MLEPDKKIPSPLLYHLSFIVGLTEEALPLNMTHVLNNSLKGVIYRGNTIQY
jgi:hypothetical protein